LERINANNNNGNDITNYATVARTSVASAWTDEHDLSRVRSTTSSKGDLIVLLESLRKAGFQLAICTADNRIPTLESLSALGISTLFDMIVCGDDGLPAKPNPEIAWTICRTLGADVKSSFIIGDTKADMGLVSYPSSFIR
jgi:phosphoglycolate phosphatase-like HAD superfamily hydrolase